ncbi:ketosteroid isomerase-like protein [Arthrobacter sp. V4I6]|uniref:ester cyclase n=1 Tax=unclassified Arthrobacter TaxID=235627 RepID=UPI002783C2E2|nr:MULTISPECIES: ester cyclase [unclassified Arthrobacter]MDQ0822333.1 ketosteroid isomerase-like protein [Arthrobacter sp. V1I7]MDQ0851959.1 ketosteroid isomerase-like protein [Arthrobacter sp. V4I6]
MSESADHNKRVVSLLIEAISRGDLTVFDELYTPRAAPKALEWVEPFLQSFPDVAMDIVQMVSEGDTVVARLRCSGTHLGVWRGHSPSGQRFNRVDEVYFFTFRNGLIDGSWGIEDNLTRFRQLGFIR